MGNPPPPIPGTHLWKKVMPSSEEWRWTTADGKVYRVNRDARAWSRAQLAGVDDDSEDEEVAVDDADALAVELVAARNARNQELVALKRESGLRKCRLRSSS